MMYKLTPLIFEINQMVCELTLKFKAKIKEDIPLTKRVRGPYCKLRTEFFFSTIYGPSAKRAGQNSKRKNEDP